MHSCSSMNVMQLDSLEKLDGNPEIRLNQSDFLLSLSQNPQWNRRISKRVRSGRHNQLNIGESTWRCRWWLHNGAQRTNRIVKTTLSTIFIFEFIAAVGGCQWHQSNRYAATVSAIFRASCTQHKTLPRPNDSSRIHSWRYGSSNLSRYAWRCPISQCFCRSNAW